MKLKILEALYGGEVRLGEQNIPDKKEYHAITQILDRERRKLSITEQEHIDKILELHTAVVSYEVQEAFYRGLAIGIKLMNEVEAVELNLD